VKDFNAFDSLESGKKYRFSFIAIPRTANNFIKSNQGAVVFDTISVREVLPDRLGPELVADVDAGEWGLVNDNL